MKKVFMICVCVVGFLYSQNLVEVYRKSGINALQKEVEKVLQSPLYWKEQIANKDVKEGYYEFNTPVVVVSKKDKVMELFQVDDNNTNLISHQDVITGKMGDKQKEGDLKTPVGVYDMRRRFTPQDIFYGPVAYELSYPNVLDRLGDKDGYGIWIHGFPLDNKQRDGKTKGCVVVSNDILEKFDKDLAGQKAVVIIFEHSVREVQKEQIQTLLSELYKWRYAWKMSHLKSYLSFYDKDFKRFDGKNLRQFSAMKKIVFSRKGDKVIRFSNIAISPYPQIGIDNLFRISFDEHYRAKNYKFDGKKELYIKLENNQMHIIAEK